MFFKNRVLWRLNKHLAGYAQPAGLPPRAMDEMINPGQYGGGGGTFEQYCDIYKARGVNGCILQILISSSADWLSLNEQDIDIEDNRRNYLYSSICEAAAIDYAGSVLGLENAEQVVSAEIEGRRQR